MYQLKQKILQAIKLSTFNINLKQKLKNRRKIYSTPINYFI